MERLYLAMIVGYAPFLSEMLHLATWEDYGSSFLWCSVSLIFQYNGVGLTMPRRIGFCGGMISYRRPSFPE